jgi:hypothetical protein
MSRDVSATTYMGALARGETDNKGDNTKLATKARTLIAELFGR